MVVGGKFLSEEERNKLWHLEEYLEKKYQNKYYYYSIHVYVWQDYLIVLKHNKPYSSILNHNVQPMHFKDYKNISDA
jgi:hypothetical protein